MSKITVMEWGAGGFCEYRPYSGGPACRNESTHRVDYPGGKILLCKDHLPKLPEPDPAPELPIGTELDFPVSTLDKHIGCHPIISKVADNRNSLKLYCSRHMETIGCIEGIIPYLHNPPIKLEPQPCPFCKGTGKETDDMIKARLATMRLIASSPNPDLDRLEALKSIERMDELHKEKLFDVKGERS